MRCTLSCSCTVRADSAATPGHPAAAPRSTVSSPPAAASMREGRECVATQNAIMHVPCYHASNREAGDCSVHAHFTRLFCGHMCHAGTAAWELGHLLQAGCTAARAPAHDPHGEVVAVCLRGLTLAPLSEVRPGGAAHKALKCIVHEVNEHRARPLFKASPQLCTHAAWLGLGHVDYNAWGRSIVTWGMHSLGRLQSAISTLQPGRCLVGHRQATYMQTTNQHTARTRLMNQSWSTDVQPLHLWVAMRQAQGQHSGRC